MRIGRESGRPQRAPAKAGASRADPAALRPSPEHKGAARRKLTYKDQRDYELLPARIEELDAAIARDEALLSDHDLYLRDHKTFEALTAAIEAAKAEREAAEHRWLELAEMAEALAS